MRRIATIAAAAALLLVAGAGRAQSVSGGVDTVRAQTESGAVVGVAHETANVFRNIPFAAPPVGPLRWRAPQPVPPWSGARQAIYPGPS